MPTRMASAPSVARSRVFVLGFNLRRGLEVPGGKDFGPSVIRGIGFAWSRSSLLSRADIKRALKQSGSTSQSEDGVPEEEA